jgi:cytochrome c553
MKHLVRAAGLLFLAAVSLRGLAAAQNPQSPSPAWAYGLPQLAPGESPAPPAALGQRGQAPAAPRPPDTSLKRIPGSTRAFTLAQLRDYWDVGDWYPEDHPPMPDVVVHGRQPHVRGCAMCHMPNGKGRPENAPLAGQPYAYLVQQLLDFKNGLRHNADARKTNTLQMIEAAKDMTDDEIKEAAAYFSSMKWTPWIRVVETDTVPRTRLSGNVFFPMPEGGTEPIGNRIIEAPEDVERFELRDPRLGFVAYVPAGSLKKGAALVAGGGNKTTPCGICHGPDMKGLGPVPALAGRSPSYIVRQLWDMHEGTRRGTWSPLMKPVVERLTQDDMLAIAAYLASLPG